MGSLTRMTMDSLTLSSSRISSMRTLLPPLLPEPGRAFSSASAMVFFSVSLYAFNALSRSDRPWCVAVARGYGYLLL